MAREALREAFSNGSDDPYEHVEMDVATRLSGAMMLMLALLAAVAPPRDGTGYIGLVALLALLVPAGVLQIRRSSASQPRTLLAGGYAVLAAIGGYRLAAGDVVPLNELLFVTVIYACVIHPVRPSTAMLGVATAIAISAGQAESAALTLMWVFGMIVAAWTARVRRQRADAKAEATLARVDALTSLYNRRGLEEAMPVMVSHHRRHNRPLSVLVCDLDDFKGINDKHGHQTGDDTLRKVAQSLTAALRLSDLCYRWGGDEFVAVLPECAFGEASDIATRVRETVALSCRTPDGKPVRVTVGAAQLGPGQTGDDLLAKADAELLLGKQRRKHVDRRTAA